MKTRMIWGTLVVLVPSLCRAAGTIEYTLTDLGTLPGGASSEAYAINNYGQVLANGTSTPGHPFIVSGGTKQDLGAFPSGRYSWGLALNDLGEAVGEADVNLGQYENAFLYASGTMTNLGTFGGTFSEAYGINDSGQIVGHATTKAYGDHAFLYSSGTMQDLQGLLPQAYSASTATAINNSGQILCNANSSGYLHAFLYSGGTMHYLGTLGGISSEAFGINDYGQIVGDSVNASGEDDAFLYASGTMIDLGTIPGTGLSQAYGINDSGLIVGECEEGNRNYAFLYSGGTMQSLTSLISPSVGWTLQDATGINNEGQICGWGLNPAGETDSFLLTPTPEPGTLALVGAGAVALLSYRWVATSGSH